jgi:hypothetical protein
MQEKINREKYTRQLLGLSSKNAAYLLAFRCSSHQSHTLVADPELVVVEITRIIETRN